MKSLIVSATEFEIAPFLLRFNLQQGINHIGTNQVFILITGVGMVATAFAMGQILSTQSFDFAVNAGIAGSFNSNLKLGEIVQVKEDCFSELGAADGSSFISIDQLGFGTRIANPIPYQVLNVLTSTLIKAKGITVNTVHGSEQEIATIIQQLQPDVESMEGAAFFYSCNKLQIPSIQIRSVSNYVERRDTAKWDIPLAIQMLNQQLILLYQTLYEA
ncbi:Menaquinone via futalosine step 2 [Arcticibacter svalbardensis MN12-7]|uniref:Futalosine hydrolase n=1 Tax=Arcticibacter svalbardensis MN12-7 TaxID=1150600 RepID=R9GZM4_9SPHI|nr:futalosine hydrolase [Arcticibacter svalbardensis]EOR94444.1 Menaquinone via futalosine step 2 [Arcticibacter svalbardensis MN12-7]